MSRCTTLAPIPSRTELRTVDLEQSATREVCIGNRYAIIAGFRDRTLGHSRYLRQEYGMSGLTDAGEFLVNPRLMLICEGRDWPLRAPPASKQF